MPLLQILSFQLIVVNDWVKERQGLQNVWITLRTHCDMTSSWQAAWKSGILLVCFLLYQTTLCIDVILISVIWTLFWIPSHANDIIINLIILVKLGKIILPILNWFYLGKISQVPKLNNILKRSNVKNLLLTDFLKWETIKFCLKLDHSKPPNVLVSL